MSANSYSRLWAVVDVNTADVCYATTQYTKCQRQYSYLKSSLGALLDLQIVRYDLAPHYRDATFGSCLKSALVGTLPKV